MEGYTEHSDQMLLDLLKAGDKIAYAAIYSRFWPQIFRFARKMLREDREAEDLTQEVFYKLWEKSAEINVTSNLSAYLYASVRNAILNKIRHDKHIDKYAASLIDFFEQAEPDTDHLIRERQLKELIEKELSALPPQMRMIFDLSRNSDMTYKQIAEYLGISEGAVRGQITRALKQLRQRLGLIAYIYLLLNGW